MTRPSFRSLRRATKGAAFGNRKFFEKNLTKNFWSVGLCDAQVRACSKLRTGVCAKLLFVR